MDKKEWKHFNWQNRRVEDKSAFIIVGPNERIDLNTNKRSDLY